MSDLQLQALVEAARAYEALFVPALFAQWAPRVADAARLAPGQRVLDVACGTGILAREARARTAPTGSIVGVDPGAGMLAVAEELAPDIGWRQGTAEALPFPDASFDAVVSQFGLMFFADHLGALREMLRVLRPGGRMAIAVWDSLEHTPAYASEVALLQRRAGTAAADAVRAPFVLGDREWLAGLMNDAGIAEVQIATQPGRARFPSVRVMLEAEVRGWLPVWGVHLSEPEIERILREGEDVFRAYTTTEGLVFDVPAHIASGRKL